VGPGSIGVVEAVIVIATVAVGCLGVGIPVADGDPVAVAEGGTLLGAGDAVAVGDSDEGTDEGGVDIGVLDGPGKLSIVDDAQPTVKSTTMMLKIAVNLREITFFSPILIGKAP
jgi:hypothetical protein